jgi:Dual specificity phosphatase, catalytic domain
MAGTSWFGNESEILPNLYVGDLQDAARFRGMIISVLPERFEAEPAHAILIPFLGNGRATLDTTAALIDAALARDLPVLVHCEEGCERAPLTVAWFLWRRRGMTLDQAYDLLQSRRPIVRDRRRWLGIYSNS